jgi:hypothetical protein
METHDYENLKRLFRVLADKEIHDDDRPAREPKEADWVIERIQDSFDSRGR